MISMGNLTEVEACPVEKGDQKLAPSLGDLSRPRGDVSMEWKASKHNGEFPDAISCTMWVMRGWAL